MCLELIQYQVLFIQMEKILMKSYPKYPKKTEYLFYMINSKHINVDFNNLPSKMSVFMLPINITSHKSNKDYFKNTISKVTKKLIISLFDGSQKSTFELVKFYIKGDKKPKVIEVMIEGSILNKVSFLTISILKMVYLHDLKCGNVYLSSGNFTSMGCTFIQVNNFYTDSYTYPNLTKSVD